ncbi:MAG: rRNA maturation RNase YbeY [Bacteroidales bacterium]
MPVYFHSEKTGFLLKNKKLYRQWIDEVVNDYSKSIGNLNFIFTTNDYLLEINKQFLNHNHFTDVITFSYNDKDIVSGDIFVSIDQVKLNSIEHKESFINELSRIMIHGVLHLLGFNDDSREEMKKMRMMETASLNRLKEYIDEKRV